MVKMPYGPGSIRFAPARLFDAASCPSGGTRFVDPARELSVVALTNTAVEGLFGQFPVQVRNAVYASL